MSTPDVLVVEDESNIRELVALHLRLEEMAPHEAADGNAGLDLARQRPYDLIILDLMLPDISGFDVADELKRQLDTASVPILVFTAKTITKQDRERLGGHVLQIMEKGSFSRQQFLAEVHRALFQG